MRAELLFSSERGEIFVSPGCNFPRCSCILVVFVMAGLA
jgi:hypothetical protein